MNIKKELDENKKQLLNIENKIDEIKAITRTFSNMLFSLYIVKEK